MSNDKETEHYAASVTAWFNTKLEHDKSLITLSTGGIGLLVTLLSTVGVASMESLVLYILAIISFVTCVGVVLWIFRRNATHLQAVIKNQAYTDPVLAVLDWIGILSFWFGVVFTAVIGISQAANSLFSKETTMTKVRDSFNGAAMIKPDMPDFTKSFNGAAGLKPDTTQSNTTQTTGGAAAQTQNQNQTQNQSTNTNQESSGKK